MTEQGIVPKTVAAAPKFQLTPGALDFNWSGDEQGFLIGAFFLFLCAPCLLYAVCYLVVVCTLLAVCCVPMLIRMRYKECCAVCCAWLLCG